MGEHQIYDGALLVEAATDEVPPEGALFAKDDFDDLRNADLVVAFTEPPRSGNSRGGRHIEAGLALAWGITLWIVGPRENVFYCLPQVRQFKTFEAVKEAMKGAE